MSVLVDTIILFILFILAIASAGASSHDARFSSYLDGYQFGKLGKATLGLAWIYTFLVGLIPGLFGMVQG